MFLHFETPINSIKHISYLIFGYDLCLRLRLTKTLALLP
jgi:hypothetical protein